MTERLIRPRVSVCEKHSTGGDVVGIIDYPDGSNNCAEAIAESCIVDPSTKEISLTFSFRNLPNHLSESDLLVVSQSTRERFRDAEMLRQTELANRAFQSITIEEYIIGCGFGVYQPMGGDYILHAP